MAALRADLTFRTGSAKEITRWRVFSAAWVSQKHMRLREHILNLFSLVRLARP
jgi:hypothetical protein